MNQREIKFRAWDRKLQRMRIYFAVDERGQIFELNVRDHTFNYVGRTDNKPDILLMQYTSLKDKNGKEIYEGDIINTKGNGRFVRKDDSIKIVYWSNINGSWCMNKEGRHVEIGNFFLRFHCHPKHIEIIGNAYENPELLI